MPKLIVDNPFTLEEACAVDLPDDADVSSVLDHGRAAARSFARTTVGERMALVVRATAAMEARSEEIAQDISRMMGKPVAQARGEVAGMAERARHMVSIAEASLADVVLPKEGFDRRIVKEPLGLVLDLPAWNYPLLTAINVVAPAVLAGNAVVVKHSPRSPLCGMHFARAFAEAGAPEHLVQSLNCDHATSERIVGDPRVDHVVYTGSVYGGHRIRQAASRRFVNVGLELGGSDPAYVAADCDFDRTVANIVDGCIYNAGQSCCAVERVYVHESLYARFIEACLPLVAAYVQGDPMHEATTLGPIAQPNHAKELEDMVRDAERHGARLLHGGRAAQVGGRGRFFEPTLVVDVEQAMRLFREESFGPIVAIASVKSDEEALAKMNDSSLGLTASLWTSDADRARRMASALEAGTVYMNRCDSVDPALPWSGVKDSGSGWSLSSLGFDQLTRPKSLHLRTSW